MLRAALAIVIVILAGCPAHGPQQIGQQPSWRNTAQAAPVAEPVTFAPSVLPAARYNEPFAAPPPSALGDAVTAEVTRAAQQAGVQVPLADARLFRACEQLAAVVPEQGIVAYSLVEFALHRNGIVEPSPHLLVVWGDIDSPSAIVEQLAPRLAEIFADGATARVGVGAAKRMPDGSGAVVFALQASAVTTTPIPRAVAAGGSFPIDAVVAATYQQPEVFLTRDNGTVERLELTLGHANAFHAVVECKASVGREQVEITASDVKGSTVLANFPVYCGTQPPASLTVEPSLDDAQAADPAAGERILLALVNKDRQAAGLPALAWDDQVASVARGHSEEMRRTKVVAHISPTTGSAADRVRAAGIKTSVVLENVARAYGVHEAHEGLMNSPGHRANLMSAAATTLGVGVVYGEEVSGRREIFVTQVFTRVPPKIDPVAAVAAIHQKIGAVRKVGVVPQLSTIAQTLADQLAAGKTRDQAYPLVKKQVDALGAVYSRVGSVITAAGDLDALDGASILGDAQPDDIGIGVAQGVHPEIGEGAIWIVVLLAERR